MGNIFISNNNFILISSKTSKCLQIPQNIIIQRKGGTSLDIELVALLKFDIC